MADKKPLVLGTGGRPEQMQTGDTVGLAVGGTGQVTAYAGKDALTVQGANIASAGTTNLATATGEYVHVTGTTTITALGTAAAGVERVVKFTGVLTLTHNATSLQLPGGASIVTAADDRAIFRSLGSGNWLCVAYVRAALPPGTIPVTDAGGDTTTWPMLATSQTGNLAPTTDAGLTYNATTNSLGATQFVGGLIGNASTATLLANTYTINGTFFNGAASILAPDPDNVIHNGNLNVWQRGVTFAAIAASQTFADRFIYSKVGAVVHTASRDAAVPTVAQSGVFSLYSMKLEVTTADSSIAAGDFSVVCQHVEGYDFQAVAQRDFTLSFWVRASTTGTYCVAFRNSGFDRAFIGTYTVSVANTWEYKSITVPASPTGGTWDYGTGYGLSIFWLQSCGTTYHTTAGAWQTGNYLASSAQVNNTGTVGNTFYLSQVMLVPGITPFPIKYVSYADELQRCQRFLLTYTTQLLGLALNGQALYNYGAMEFPVEMRANPSLVAGATYSVNAGSAGTVAVTSTTSKGIGFTNGSSNWTATAIVQVTCLLTAEL